MSRLSNRIMVSVLEDGRQIIANIMVANGSLSQAWNGGTAIPDFTETAKQPLLYLSIMNNGARDNMNVSGTWYYNNAAVTGNSKFQVTTHTVGGVQYPALRIVGNLASSDNTDVDTISFVGSFQREGDTIPIQASVLFNIIRMQEGSWFGVVTPGMAEVDSDSAYVDLTATLYDDKGAVQGAGTFTTRWTVDAPEYSTTTEQNDNQGSHTFRITGSQFYDYASITCRFVVEGETKWTALAAVDDIGDQYSVGIISVQGATSTIDSQTAYGEGTDAKLRSGQSVKYKIYVVDKNDPSTNATIAAGIAKAYIRLYDHLNAVYTGDGINPQAVVSGSGGYRELTKVEDGGERYFTFTVSFEAAKAVFGGSLSGVLLLAEQNPWSNS